MRPCGSAIAPSATTANAPPDQFLFATGSLDPARTLVASPIAEADLAKVWVATDSDDEILDLAHRGWMHGRPLTP